MDGPLSNLQVFAKMPNPPKSVADKNYGIASLRLLYKSLILAAWEARIQNNEMTT
jgi:hypothetical protein